MDSLEDERPTLPYFETPEQAFFARALPVLGVDIEDDDEANAAWMACMRRRSYARFIVVLVGFCSVIFALSISR